jgi:hypothetical protein
MKIRVIIKNAFLNLTKFLTLKKIIKNIIIPKYIADSNNNDGKIFINRDCEIVCV